MNWLEHYRTTYYPLLNINATGVENILAHGMYNRAIGFDIMWRLLLNQKSKDFNIIETGTLRTPNNWTDGQSAALFTRFVEHHGGQMRSVDIDPGACDTAQKFIASEQFTVTCNDSVTWLKQQTNLDQVDLFYLDSYDVDWNNDTDSASHHLKEFQVIEPFIRPGTVVAIDDNSRWVASNQRTGKGRAVVEYLETRGQLPIYDEYQIIFQF
jgi:predicted O-methyltransferase YrrM